MSLPGGTRAKHRGAVPHCTPYPCIHCAQARSLDINRPVRLGLSRLYHPQGYTPGCKGWTEGCRTRFYSVSDTPVVTRSRLWEQGGSASLPPVGPKRVLKV